MPQSTLLLLLVTAGSIIGVCHCQVTFYCDSSNKIDISHENFRIVTRNSNSSGYGMSTTCVFQTQATGYYMYFVEIITADTRSAALTVRVDGVSKFSGSSSDVKDHSRSLFLPTGRLSVEFRSGGDSSGRRGFELRVTRVARCPPGWTEISNSCFGTSRVFEGQRLNYTDAQRSCNSMRANLMHVPSSFYGDVDDLKSRLSSSLTTDAWIGMTDLAVSLSPRWLDGTRFYRTNLLGCGSSTIYSSTYCGYSLRCTAFSSFSSYRPLRMQTCSQMRNYVCSMPLRGTNRFYSVPNQVNTITYTYYFRFTWLYYVVGFGAFFLVGGIISFLIAKSRSRSRLSATRTVGGPPGSYPTQVPPYSVTVGSPQQVQTGPVPPPPTYSEPVGANNQAFKY